MTMEQRIIETTATLYRDDPVEHVRTIVIGSSRHYECKHCSHRLWTTDDEALERFVTDHEEH
jgi:hypothetical protein